MTATLALDVGATKVAYGFVEDSDPLTAHATGVLPTQPDPAKFGARQAAGQIAAAVRAALEQPDAPGDVVRVGVGAPGVIDREGVVVHNGDTLPGWAGTDLNAVVRSELDVPVACHNDVRVWAFGEHLIGAGRTGSADLDRGRVLYVSLGTGVGGALVSDGELAAGPTGTAGEISELVCADFRGMADRAENIASGNSLARYYNELSADPDHGRVEWRAWRETDLRLPEILERMRGGDALARSIIEGNLAGLGRCLGALASGLDLSAIVLGGGVTGIGAEVTDPLIAGVREAALAPNKTVPVLTSAFISDAPLVAAACFARTVAGRDVAAGRPQHNTEE